MIQGVYILIKDSDILYVGASRNIEDRLYYHRNKDYDYFVIIPCIKRYQELETRFITYLNPTLNKFKKYINLWEPDSPHDGFKGFKSGKISWYINA